MRLHGQREAALDWRKGRRTSSHEHLITLAESGLFGQFEEVVTRRVGGHAGAA